MESQDSKIIKIIHSPYFERNLFFIAVASVFVIMLTLNILTPLIADDFSFSGSKSIIDVFKNEYHQYMAWSGRSVAHLLARTFLMLPKMIFNLFNSLALTWLTILIYIFSNSNKKYCLPLYMFINFTIWLYVANYGQTILWLTGSCNYLWGTTIILSFLLPYHLYLIKGIYFKRNILAIIGMFLFGIIAGWCNENTSAGCILTVILFLVYGKVSKINLQKWMFSGLAGNIVGWFFMILAPGNAIRASHPAFATDASLLVKLADRFLKCTHFLKSLMPLLVIFIVSIIIQIVLKPDWKRNYLSFSYFIVSMATVYALVLSPAGQGGRAMFGATIFLILACSHCLADIFFKTDILKFMAVSIITILGLQFAFSFIDGVYDIAYTKRQYDKRTAYIELQKSNGNLDIVVPFITKKLNVKHVASYGLGDLSSDSTHWINSAYIRKYGLESIRGMDINEWQEIYGNEK